jgi:hypothetical protein
VTTEARIGTPALAALLLVAAVAIRCLDYGNPVIHVDEQYYLLAGSRMLEGAVPYVDIWDRKPVGLFLLYAGMAALPGDDILGYQLVATLFAAATALVVHRAALMTGAAQRGAIAAAVAYLIWLPILGGRGGQAPVFYNLLVAGAALLTLRLPRVATARAMLVNGIAACLLAGLAIQVKPTAAFEGAFFGLAHLWTMRRFGVGRSLGAGAVWAAVGMGPTLAAFASYAGMGERAADAWWFANVTSILLRPGYPSGEILMRLLGIGAQLAPLILCAGVASRWRGDSAAARLTFGWVAAALVGFLAIGTFFDHYALPLIAPLAVAGARTFGRFPRAMIGALGLAALLVLVERVFVPRDTTGARAVAAVVQRNSGDECPYVFIGDTITYQLADACLPTAYAFPNLLAYATEQGATGIDEAAEVRHILARRPPVIVVSTRQLAIWNRGSIAALKAALRADYRVVFTAPRGGYRTVVYLRNDRSFRR